VEWATRKGRYAIVAKKEVEIASLGGRKSRVLPQLLSCFHALRSITRTPPAILTSEVRGRSEAQEYQAEAEAAAF